MALRYLSEHYGPASSSTVAPPTSLPETVEFAPPGKSGATSRHIQETLDFSALSAVPTLATGDTWRIFSLLSSARIHDLRASTGVWTASTITFDLGLYESGTSHDGVSIDDDLFGSDVAFTSALIRADMFDESGALADVDRGRALWELLGLSAAPQPEVSYDFVATLTVTSFFASSPIHFECDYTLN